MEPEAGMAQVQGGSRALSGAEREYTACAYPNYRAEKLNRENH